jgi:cytochrome c553
VRRMTFLPPQRQHGWAFRSPAGAALILPAAVLALSFSSPAAAQGNVSKAEADAKLRYCEVCHGASAQGFHGYYPIPRLAGQPTEYLKNQLQAFVERRRTSNIMFNVGHVLSPAMIDALTTDFNQLNPKPLGALQKKTSTKERGFSKMESLGRMFLRAPHVTVPKPRATGRFRAWPANSTTTSPTS